MKIRLIFLLATCLLPVFLFAQAITLTPVLPIIEVRDATSYVYRFTLSNNHNGSIIAPGSLKITSSDLNILTSTISGQNADLMVSYTNNNVGSSSKTGTLKVSAQYWEGGDVTKVRDLSPITISVKIVPTIFYNTRREVLFKKNDCGDWYLPTGYTMYVVEAKKYSSYISQINADAQAEQDIRQNGQNYANLHGACVRENEIRKPKGTYNYAHEDYKENIVWDISRIQGQSVKIERIDNYTGAAILIAANAPNNGLFVNGLNKTLPASWDCSIKITVLGSGAVFLSEGFPMATD